MQHRAASSYTLNVGQAHGKHITRTAQVLAFEGVRAGHEGLQRHVQELQQQITILQESVYGAVVCPS